MQSVVGYIRVSTDEQVGDDKFGLLVQREEIEEYCLKQGYCLSNIYSDEGYSGGTLERPELISMMDASGFDKVVIAKYDRLSRDLFGQLYIERELNAKNIEIISVREPFSGKTPEMELMRQMIGAFAQFEKQRITQRLHSGRLAKRKGGGFIGGQAPLGYYTDKGSKCLHVDIQKATTVRRIFDLKGTATLERIASILNSEGHTSRDGKRLTAMQIKRVVEREPLYRGDLAAQRIL